MGVESISETAFVLIVKSMEDSCSHIVHDHLASRNEMIIDQEISY